MSGFEGKPQTLTLIDSVKINDTDPIETPLILTPLILRVARNAATSSRAGVQFESKRIDHLHDGHELGVALLAQRLV